MSAGFSVSGLVSGIDTNSILSQLMSIERIPVRSMQSQQAEAKQGIDAWASITTRVSALETASKGLDKLSDFDGFVSSTSSSAAVTAVTSGAADIGSVSFTVDQLASQHQLIGDVGFAASTDTVGDGDVIINIGGADHTITTNDATTVSDLASAINDLDIGVNASVITASTGDVRLMLTSADTGADAAFTVTTSGTGTLSLPSFLEVSTAADSQITFGTGVDQVTVNRSTNTVGDLISGVTLTLNQTTTNAVSISTSRDTDAAVEAVQTFVSELNSTLNQLGAAASNDPTTGGGPLAGSRVVREIMDGIRRSVSQPVQSLSGNFSYASSVGLEIQSNGSFVLNESKLRTAMADDFGAVADLFAASARATDTRVSFLDAKSSTAAGSYAVDITQAAEVATLSGAASGSDPASSFTIVAPGGEEVDVTTLANDTAALVVQRINDALSAAGVTSLSASVGVGSGFSIDATTFGASTSFEIKASPAGDPDTFGLFGTDSGEDVAGTIGGDAATGSGRTLTSIAGVSNGLKLKVTAGTGATGAFGTVDYSTGIAGTLQKLLDEYQDSEGTIANAKDSLQGRVDLYQDRIEAFERRLVLREEGLRRQFSAMEAAIAQFQSSANFFAAQMGLQSQQ